MPSTRVKQVAIGSSVILACGGVIIALSLLRRLPGFTGEFFGKIAGILSTPLFMEIGIGLLGFLALLAVNHIRRLREGDEFVDLGEFAGRNGMSDELGNEGPEARRPEMPAGVSGTPPTE